MFYISKEAQECDLYLNENYTKISELIPFLYNMLLGLHLDDFLEETSPPNFKLNFLFKPKEAL